MKGLTLLIGCALLVSACAADRDTPAAVTKEYERLKGELDQDTIGESIQRLEAFRKANEQYRIAATVAEDVTRLSEQARGRFHMARELARGPELSRAEKILNDLATSLPDTDDGRMAREFMQFDFHMLKASLLMNEGRLAEADQTVRQLLGTKLDAARASQVERVLDAIHTSAVAALENGCRLLRVSLEAARAEQGQYPSALSLDNLPLRNPGLESEIAASLSSIESYQPTRDGFSFIAVGKDGKTRRRVTERGIERP